MYICAKCVCSARDCVCRMQVFGKFELEKPGVSESVSKSKCRSSHVGISKGKSKTNENDPVHAKLLLKAWEENREEQKFVASSERAQ